MGRTEILSAKAPCKSAHCQTIAPGVRSVSNALDIGTGCPHGEQAKWGALHVRPDREVPSAKILHWKAPRNLRPTLPSSAPPSSKLRRPSSRFAERIEFSPFNDGATRGYQFAGTGSYGRVLLGDPSPTSNGGLDGLRTRVCRPPRAFVMVERIWARLTKRRGPGD